MTSAVVSAPGRARPSGATTIAMEGLSYTYPAWSELPAAALRDVDLELGPGVTLVHGDSGSGKSTLLRVCNGLVPHFHGGTVRGRAAVCGLEVVDTPTRQLARHVGFVFQEPDAGFVRGTVAREVAFFPENLGLPRATIAARVEEALSWTGISQLARRRLATLSGGERQRVALAAALAGGASVIALDEPLSQLDAAGAAALVVTLRALADRGTTVVVAEHRLGGFRAARRVPLVDGRIVASAPEPSSPASATGGGAISTSPASTSPASTSPASTSPASASPASTSPAGPTAWSLSDVTLGAGGMPLVDRVDLFGRVGEVVIVTGPNGAGKSTLLRTIAGLTAPLSGHVERRPGRVAYLPQEPGLLLHRQSVRAEIEQTLRWSQVPGGADAILEILGLGGLAGRDPRDLSGGQRQRAALAVVLAGRPALALLDEPTRGMDAAARASLAKVMRRLAEGGAAVVAATHDVELARELRGRVVRIEGQRLVPDEAGSR